MKSKTAKEILAESLREVAETQQIDKITIRDIVDNYGYGKMWIYKRRNCSPRKNGFCLLRL